ncbi:ISAs1 family transposase, partial [Bacteroides sp. 1_1_30]|uniref:ISAs1 family transposase n=1 Tax=Bacteroides sp. 1_1_30 TaxID=457387 RepID=UPI00021378E9
ENDFIKRAEETTEGHGFMVTRTCISCSEPSRLGFCYRDWKNLRTYGIIKTEKINIATGEIQNEKHCFISSLVNNPELILKYKRKHWAVENGLHWQLDVTFNEDDGRKMMNSAQKLFHFN